MTKRKIPLRDILRDLYEPKFDKMQRIIEGINKRSK